METTKLIDAHHSNTIYFNGKLVNRVDEIEQGHFIVKFRKTDGTEQKTRGHFRFLNSVRQLFADRKAEIQWMYVWYLIPGYDGRRWRYTRTGGWQRCRYCGLKFPEPEK